VHIFAVVQVPHQIGLIEPSFKAVPRDCRLKLRPHLLIHHSPPLRWAAGEAYIGIPTPSLFSHQIRLGLPFTVCPSTVSAVTHATGSPRTAGAVHSLQIAMAGQ